MITKLTIPGPDFIPSAPVAGAVKDPVNVLGGMGCRDVFAEDELFGLILRINRRWCAYNLIIIHPKEILPMRCDASRILVTFHHILHLRQ
jgi:hypothetical protein